MNKNNLIIAIVLIAIAGGGGFYTGTKYRSSRGPAQFVAGNFGGGNRGFRAGGNAALGTIIAKDANSITIQLGGPNATSTNGSASGSKIVLYNTSTEIGKTVTGSSNDLTIGEAVVANGTANSDGSLTAQMIQIRPAGMGGQRPNGQ